jgi:hypothetical protein
MAEAGEALHIVVVEPFQDQHKNFGEVSNLCGGLFEHEELVLVQAEFGTLIGLDTGSFGAVAGLAMPVASFLVDDQCFAQLAPHNLHLHPQKNHHHLDYNFACSLYEEYFTAILILVLLINSTTG